MGEPAVSAAVEHRHEPTDLVADGILGASALRCDAVNHPAGLAGVCLGFNARAGTAGPLEAGQEVVDDVVGHLTGSKLFHVEYFPRK
jgi:hypothetical protein